MAVTDDLAERVERQRRAGRDEEDDEHGQRPALHRFFQRVAPRRRDVFDDEPRGERREQRFNMELRAEARDERAEPEQGDRYFAADVSKVERKQRAARGAERKGPEHFP